VGLLRQLAVAAVDAVLPPRCLSCELYLDDVTAVVAVVGDAGLGASLLCPLCRDQLRAATDSPAYFAYGGILADLTKRAKYSRDTATGLGLARLFADAVAAEDARGGTSLGAIDVVTYVPAPLARVVSRGFDLPALLAEQAASALSRPCVPLLRVTRRDPRLANAADAEERARLVAGRFVADPQQASGKRVLLVDDVVTTGATTVEATAVLAGAGVDVVVRCLAQTPYPGDDGVVADG
jgi:predicted amidophosphoribosyltransferase